MPLVTVHLQGGPCDGQTAAVAEDFGIWPPVYCGGDTYTHVAGSSNPVLYKDTGPTVTGIKAPALHQGWERWRHSINKTMHDTLVQSQKSTDAALRTLAKARKVRL